MPGLCLGVSICRVPGQGPALGHKLLLQLDVVLASPLTCLSQPGACPMGSLQLVLFTLFLPQLNQGTRHWYLSPWQRDAAMVGAGRAPRVWLLFTSDCPEPLGMSPAPLGCMEMGAQASMGVSCALCSLHAQCCTGAEAAPILDCQRPGQWPQDPGVWVARPILPHCCVLSCLLPAVCAPSRATLLRPLALSKHVRALRVFGFPCASCLLCRKMSHGGRHQRDKG